ncbi:MAG: hypothetical protein Fur0044_25380 [Anaerolineae bacterium]
MQTDRQTITWQHWPEAIKLFLRGATLSSSLRVALVVGMILTIINQGDKFINGVVTPLSLLQTGMNFAVPFCVSSYGFLMACRHPKSQPVQAEVDAT